MQKALICDIDGTLAHMNGRGPFEWDKVGEDLVDEPVADLLRRYAGEHVIILVSGRSEECRDLTLQWLRENMVFYDLLYMRQPLDYRADRIVKREIYERDIQPHYSITFCLDDRNQAVACWRELGLKCFQVAPGDF
ncbi:MAG TPA: hypothetical protein VH593_29460 [Ktedonobacteraceae bacterium]|jgi:hypothetical protein